MPKTITYNLDAQVALRDGIDTLANAVKVTLGPRGRNVVLERPVAAPLVTKDGLTVAREIQLEDPTANVGAQLVKEVAERTNELVGDGTTTSIVLAQHIFRAALKHITAGRNPRKLTRGINRAVARVGETLQAMSRDVTTSEEVGRVAAISANNDAQLGALIADAIDRVGRDGVVTIEPASSAETVLETTEGMQINQGYCSPHFVTDPEAMEVVLEDAYVLATDEKISAVQPLLPLLERVARSGAPLLIAAERIEGQALAALVTNKTKGTLQVAAVEVPGTDDRRRELLEDLAALTGGTFASSAKGHQLTSMDLDQLGRTRRAVLTQDRTTIVGGAGDLEALAEHVGGIRHRLATVAAPRDKEALRERLARLTGGVAVLRIGAPSEVEMQEKKMRAEDALHATRAALEEGVLPGGGVALLRTIPALDEIQPEDADEQVGIQIIQHALEVPLRQIASNAALEENIVIEHVQSEQGDYGLNALTGTHEPLLEAGVIDPTKVVRIALENAASVASLLFTTDSVVVDLPKKPAA